MAVNDGFFIPYTWISIATATVLKINGNMYIAHTSNNEKGGLTKIVLVDSNGLMTYERDLIDYGVTHIFTVESEVSAQTNTWKLAIQTFPKDEFGTDRRAMFILDTGIPVNWIDEAQGATNALAVTNSGESRLVTGKTGEELRKYDNEITEPPL